MASQKERIIPIEHIQRIKQIGEKIKELRLQSGKLSYEGFAYKNGIQRITYFNLESGKNFNMSTLLKVLDAHSMTLEEFFKGLK